MKFTFNVDEVFRRKVTVEAKDKDEALREAERMYLDGEIVFSESDYINTIFRPVKDN